MKRVLVTGAGGFVGRHLCHAAGTEDATEWVPYPKGRNLSADGALDSFGADIDAVVHLAGKTFVPDSWKSPEIFYRVNVLSALNVAEFCRRAKVKKCVNVNTYVYGPPQYLPVDEKHPISLPSPYHRGKKCAEDLLFDVLDSTPTKVISFRVFNLYGPWQAGHFLLPHIMRQAVKSDKVQVRDIRPRRDYLHVGDFADLITRALAEVEGASGCFNVGSGVSHSVEEVVKTVGKVMGKEIQLHSEEIERPNEVMDCVANISKVSAAFDWRPSLTLEVGISDCLKHEHGFGI